MLIAQVRSGGKPLEVEELEFAIRRKNVDAIKDVLRRQPTKEKLDELVRQYDFANGEGSLTKALYGATGDATFAAYAPKSYSQGALLHGRDVAHAAESLARPAKHGRRGRGGVARRLRPVGARRHRGHERRDGRAPGDRRRPRVRRSS